MLLEEQINKDYIQAMKDRDSQKSAAINYLRAMIKQVKIDRRLEKVEDHEVVAVIKKQIKQRQDSIEQFEKGARVDLAAKEQAEIDVMKVYLPLELSAEEIKSAITAVLSELGTVTAKDIGLVMKAVRERVGSRADGRLVSDLVKQSLAAL